MQLVNENQAIVGNGETCFGCNRILPAGIKTEYRKFRIGDTIGAHLFCDTCVAVASAKGKDLSKERFIGRIRNSDQPFWDEAYIVTEGILSQYQSMSKKAFKELMDARDYKPVWV